MYLFDFNGTHIPHFGDEDSRILSTMTDPPPERVYVPYHGKGIGEYKGTELWENYIERLVGHLSACSVKNLTQQRDVLNNTIRSSVYGLIKRLAERAVQTFKCVMTNLSGGSVQAKVSKFLGCYRITPQSNAGTSPASLIFGWRVCCKLDAAKPNMESIHEADLAQAVP